MSRDDIKDPPPLDFLYDDCTRNHTVNKYMSHGVNFWQKSLVHQKGISRIILWKFLYLANCIVRNQKLYRDRVRYENVFLIM